MAVLWQITLKVNTIRAKLAIPDDSGEPKAVKNLGASLCVHVINGRVQEDEASFSCCTNSSSNLASYCLQYSFCVESSARNMISHCMLLYRHHCVYVGTLIS